MKASFRIKKIETKEYIVTISAPTIRSAGFVFDDICSEDAPFEINFKNSTYDAQITDIEECGNETKFDYDNGNELEDVEVDNVKYLCEHFDDLYHELTNLERNAIIRHLIAERGSKNGK